MWEMLVFEKGYSDENVFVLFAGGLDYPHDPDANCPSWWDDRYDPRAIHPDIIDPLDGHITDYAANIENVNNVFTNLANTANEDDFLFVWTFDHGGWDGEHAYLCLIHGEYMWDYEFAALTDQINCHKKVFWMQQCHSGGFIDDLQGEDTFIITACNWSTGASRADDETVYGDPAIENEVINGIEYHHGEFNFHIYSSTNGRSPAYYTHYPEYTGELYTDADSDEDGIISVYESADWEITHESQGENPEYSDLGNIGETTSLEYPTIINQDITSSQTVRGLSVNL
jgi:hypothetical protein